MTKRAMIYTRVSHDPNRRERSVGQQEAELRSDAGELGWDVVAVFTDNDISASRIAGKERPGWEKAISYIRDGNCDVLMTWENSRAARDMTPIAALRDIGAKVGLSWYYDGRTHDFNNPRDVRDMFRDTVDAEYSSAETSKRILRDTKAKAMTGEPHGKVLYGYRRVYIPGSNGKPIFVEQVPNEEQAPYVVEAVKRVLSGETPYAVAKDFNARGIPAPRNNSRGWEQIQLKRMCVNPAYAGKRVFRGEIVGDAVWPALIAEADHLMLVHKLNDPARNSHPGKESIVSHLLTGIARCGVCGEWCRVQKNRKNYSYMCKTSFCVSRKEHDMDRLVSDVMVEYLTRLDLASMIDSSDSEIQEASEEARTLRARLDSYYDAAASGELTAAALIRIEPRLLAEIAAVESRLAKAVKSPLLAATAGPDAESVWNDLEISQKRELIRLLMTVTILPAQRGQQKFDENQVDIEWLPL